MCALFQRIVFVFFWCQYNVTFWERKYGCKVSLFNIVLNAFVFDTFWYPAATGHSYPIQIVAVLFLMGFKFTDPIFRLKGYWKWQIIRKFMSDFQLSKLFLSFEFKKAHLGKSPKNQSLKKKRLRSGWFLRGVDMIRKWCFHRLSIIKILECANPPAVRNRKSTVLFSCCASQICHDNKDLKQI